MQQKETKKTNQNVFNKDYLGEIETIKVDEIAKNVSDQNESFEEDDDTDESFVEDEEVTDRESEEDEPEWQSRNFIHSQRNEVGSSPLMEYGGFVRCLSFLKLHELNIDVFVSDRHISIAKLMQEKEN
eukprot:gene7354-13085_t